MEARQSVGQGTDQWGCSNPERFVQHLAGVNGQVVAEAGDVAGAPVGQSKEHGTYTDQRNPQPPPWPALIPAIKTCRQEDLADGQPQHQVTIHRDLIDPVRGFAGEVQQQAQRAVPRSSRAMVSGSRP